MATECSFDGCTDPARCRGWCNRHYCRWKRNGDPAGVIAGRVTALTEQQVAEVRRRVRQRFESPGAVAADLGVARKTVVAALRPDYKPKVGA